MNFSGLNLGSGCTARFGSIAIVLGPDTSTAVAGDPSVFSLFNIAISVGGTATHPTETLAGVGDANGLPNIGNVAFATAGSGAEAYGLINLAASLGGSISGLSSAGVGNSTLNLGSNNVVVASGFVNNSTVLFSDDNFVTALNPVNLTGLLSGFNVAFSIFGGGNEVAAAASNPDATATPSSLFFDRAESFMIPISVVDISPLPLRANQLVRIATGHGPFWEKRK